MEKDNGMTASGDAPSLAAASRSREVLLDELAEAVRGVLATLAIDDMADAEDTAALLGIEDTASLYDTFHRLSTAYEAAIRSRLNHAAAADEPCSEAPQPASLPDGYVIVPREPTDAMCEAGWDWDDHIIGTDTHPKMRGTWRAMLSAAPQPASLPDGWRDISTAPKGKKVLVLVPNGRKRPPITMMGRYWRRGTLEVAEGYDGEDWAVEINGEFYMPEGWYEECEVEDAPAHNIEPTHWMPLPAPPLSAAPKPEGG